MSCGTLSKKTELLLQRLMAGGLLSKQATWMLKPEHIADEAEIPTSERLRLYHLGKLVSTVLERGRQGDVATLLGIIQQTGGEEAADALTLIATLHDEYQISAMAYKAMLESKDEAIRRRGRELFVDSLRRFKECLRSDEKMDTQPCDKKVMGLAYFLMTHEETIATQLLRPILDDENNKNENAMDTEVITNIIQQLARTLTEKEIENITPDTDRNEKLLLAWSSALETSLEHLTQRLKTLSEDDINEILSDVFAAKYPASAALRAIAAIDRGENNDEERRRAISDIAQYGMTLALARIRETKGEHGERSVSAWGLRNNLRRLMGRLDMSDPDSVDVLNELVEALHGVGGSNQDKEEVENLRKQAIERLAESEGEAKKRAVELLTSIALSSRKEKPEYKTRLRNTAMETLARIAPKEKLLDFVKGRGANGKTAPRDLRRMAMRKLEQFAADEDVQVIAREMLEKGRDAQVRAIALRLVLSQQSDEERKETVRRYLPQLIASIPKGLGGKPANTPDIRERAALAAYALEAGDEVLIPDETLKDWLRYEGERAAAGFWSKYGSLMSSASVNSEAFFKIVENRIFKGGNGIGNEEIGQAFIRAYLQTQEPFYAPKPVIALLDRIHEASPRFYINALATAGRDGDFTDEGYTNALNKIIAEDGKEQFMAFINALGKDIPPKTREVVNRKITLIRHTARPGYFSKEDYARLQELGYRVPSIGAA